MLRFAALCLTALFLLPACDVGTRSTTSEDSTNESRSSAAAPKGPAEPNWAELRKRVPDVEAKEKEILDLMGAAFDEFKQSKTATPDDAKKLLKSAKDKKIEAMGLYDVLEEAATKVHKDLFRKSSGFKAFQSSWDRFSKDKEFATIQRR